MKTFRPARRRIDVSVGESVRIIRELQGYSQNELARLTGIPQATISAIENDRNRLGVERAKTLALALQCHPAVLVFPGWEVYPRLRRLTRRCSLRTNVREDCRNYEKDGAIVLPMPAVLAWGRK